MENSVVPLPLREILKDFMKELNFSFLSCLYVASRDGFGSNDFHSKCDGKNKIIVIIKANGFYFGGYTSSAFNSAENGNWVESDYSFIFSLSNPQNKPTFFKCVDPQYSIYHSNYGPIFGSGHDICIKDNSNQTNDNWTNIEHSYKGKKNRKIIFIFIFIFKKLKKKRLRL